MAQSLTRRATAFVIHELIGELLYFPVWWYSQGLMGAWRAVTREWLDLAERLSLRILFKNMGKPMYGDYTRSGKAISLFFRIFLVVVLSAVLLMWTVILVVAMTAWIVGPLLAGGMFIRHLLPV